MEPREGRTGGQATKRFEAKREAIVAAAADVINQQSAKGMTFADVARRVGLNTTSVTYYFKRKEDLAAACFEQTLERLEAMLDVALQEHAPETRVGRFLAENFRRLARIRTGAERDVAALSDLRAMEDPLRERLLDAWRLLHAKARRLWGTPANDELAGLIDARAHLLLENMSWLPTWLAHYDLDEYPRIEARLREIFFFGIAAPDQRWAPSPLRIPPQEHEAGREMFLHAATRLINELGYRGASVERIVAELNVTKGSFYHHLDAKDELVIACCRRSFDTIGEAQRAAEALSGSHWLQLTSVLAHLLAAQFSDTGPLLRTTALSGLPLRVRTAMIDRSNRVARRFAGMMIDGVAEGSVRPVDPLIAAQALMALHNAALDLRSWAERMPVARACGLYASTLAFGMFDDSVLEHFPAGNTVRVKA